MTKAKATLLMTIKMVDLQTQYARMQSEIDAAMHAVMAHGLFINGPEVAGFAQDLAHYLKVHQIIPCANGTDALQLALMALKLQPGDEVITANFTFIATVEVIALLGLKPVLVDVDPDTFNIDPAAIEQAIGPKTKAIIPVHLFGQMAPMKEITDLAEKYQLKVIEDSAQAMGTRFPALPGAPHAGTIGTIGTTSFFPSKTLGCYGDGGALMTQDEALGQRIQELANHGTLLKYHHRVIGVNSRLDTLQAAVLQVKLKYLEQFIEARQKAARYYDEALLSHPEITIPKRVNESTHTFHQYTIKLPQSKRDGVKEKLAEAGIPSMVYYPVPLSLQEAFKFGGYKKGDLPVSELLCKEVLSLPMHTELDEKQQDYIIDHLLKAL